MSVNSVRKGIDGFGETSIPLHRDFQTHFVFGFIGYKRDDGFVSLAFCLV